MEDSVPFEGRALSSNHPAIRFRWGSHVQLIGTQSPQTEMPMMFVYEITPTGGQRCTVMLRSLYVEVEVPRQSSGLRSLSTGSRP